MSDDDDATASAQDDDAVHHETFSIVDDCASPSSVYRPIVHPKEVWEVTLPTAYRRYMKQFHSESADLEDYSVGGMVVPFEVRYDPDKGRGLYAAEDIKKGTRVWDESHFHWFDKDEDYLAFLRYLPPTLQCDIILWTYPAKGSTTEVAIPFDEGVYMNDGGPGSSRNNVSANTVTLRDIKAGEELVQDYTKFIDLDNEVQWFAELRERVFGKHHYTQQGAPPSLRQNNNENTKVESPAATTDGLVSLSAQQDAATDYYYLSSLSSSTTVLDAILSHRILVPTFFLLLFFLVKCRVLSRYSSNNNKAHGN